jgi:hypothetical protein
MIVAPVKVSDDCAAAFAAIAAAQGFSKAALFEDLVAERLQHLEGQGGEAGHVRKKR